MPNVLLIKTSSLGDVVHNLPVVHDIRNRFPRAAIDWVVEEAYADIVGMHPGVRRVIPVAVRRWRGNVLSLSHWREYRQFRRALSGTRYDCVIDSQGLIKSAILARSAGGVRHGYASSSAREPLAARFYEVRHAVPRDLHAVVRNRRLAALSLGYEVPLTLDYGISVPDGAHAAPDGPYCVLLHATSRSDKLWPESSWIELGHDLARRGFLSVFPWGGLAERERSERLASQCTGAIVPARLSILQMARLLAHSRAVVGVDTGFTHLAAALDKPVVAVYCRTRPGLTGVYAGSRAKAINLGEPGAPPHLDEVLNALQQVTGGESA